MPSATQPPLRSQSGGSARDLSASPGCRPRPSLCHLLLPKHPIPHLDSPQRPATCPPGPAPLTSPHPKHMQLNRCAQSRGLSQIKPLWQRLPVTTVTLAPRRGLPVSDTFPPWGTHSEFRSFLPQDPRAGPSLWLASSVPPNFSCCQLSSSLSQKGPI